MPGASLYAAADVARSITANGLALLRILKILVAVANSLAEQQNALSHSVGNQEPSSGILVVCTEHAIVNFAATHFPISAAVVADVAIAAAVMSTKAT